MIVFISLIVLIIIIILLSMILLLNHSVFLISLKVFNNGFYGDFEMLVNLWGFMFLFMVVVISSSVIIFSCSYMNGLPLSNFIVLYMSFVISMLWLIFNNNFYWMMFGWDGLGVVSFLLIIFYMNYESVNNGLFTLFQNRIGDLFFVLFMVGMVDMFMTTNLVLTWGFMFLFLGGCVKSAQFPFNSWLLSAMSAPTPISSLVHSSTLVVAGVYILLQFSYCLTDMMLVLKFLSFITLVVSSFGLLNEIDMKKLIAYSTMSHVALMMFMLSFQLFKVTFFHLNIHAMFKSLMFMCFGFVMLSSYHSQDKRLISLLYFNPLIKIMYYYSCLCLAGLPFLSGFFSKDFMIEKLMETSTDFYSIFFLLFFLSISIYYSMKLLSLIFPMFSYVLVEKNSLGLVSLFSMAFISVFIINVYISLIFSLTLESFSFKISIYFFVLIMLLLSLLTNLNFKLFNYDKIKNFYEIWMIDYYSLDKFVYWNVFIMLNYLSMLSNIKLILLMNWWVLVCVVVFY